MGDKQGTMEDMEISLFSSIYKNKKVFITGHTGFKGSWLALWLTKMGAEVIGYSLNEERNPSHHDLLHLPITNYYGDILDSSSLEEAIHETQPEIIFHLAAQSLVRASYCDPVVTYQTNVVGTLNVLEAARSTASVKVIINVTTDKVYENKEWNWPYREDDTLGGYDLYSSSKACSEILTSSYRNSFFNLNAYGKKHHVLLATARAGNVIGGGDWAADRLIPDAVKATQLGVPVEIRSPSSIRPWEHVLEPLSGYLLLGQKLLESKKEIASSWNFGPDQSQILSVGDLLSRFCHYWPEVEWKDRSDNATPMHEAKILKLDCSKAYADLKWKSVWNLEETLQHTASWYKNYYSEGVLNSEKDLEEYVVTARQRKISWAL